MQYHSTKHITQANCLRRYTVPIYLPYNMATATTVHKMKFKTQCIFWYYGCAACVFACFMFYVSQCFVCAFH